MIRFVSGIILTALAALGLVTGLLDDSVPLEFYVYVAIFAVAGILLLFFGKRAIAFRNHE